MGIWQGKINEETENLKGLLIETSEEFNEAYCTIIVSHIISILWINDGLLI